MTPREFFALGLRACGLLLVCAGQGLPQDRLAEPWRTPYSGDHAAGGHVIGYWRFEADGPANDSGPNKLSGRLDGAVAVAAGKHGGGLESFAGWPVEDKRHALLVTPHRALSPPGAFTAELWVQAKPELAKAGQAYLLDKKYVSHSDYQWLLGAPKPSGARPMVVNLGFGTDSESFWSDSIDFAPGVWQITARERAAGLTATHFLRVNP